MRYTTVLLDLDHTLLDSDASHAAAFDATMRSVGVDEPDLLFDTFDRINRALWRRVERHELSPNDVKVLRFRLAPRVRLGLVTNGIGSVQRGRIDRLGLVDTFETVVISGEVGMNKPGAAIFDLALQALGEPDRAECVMVGDNLGSDVQGGINAGIDTIWYNPNRIESGPGIEPTHTVGDLGEVCEIVSSIELPPNP